MAIDGENALTETRVGSEADGLNRRTVRKNKSGRDIVLRGLRGGLHERKLRIGERRSDSGLVEIGETEAAADDSLFGEEIRDTDARAEVAPMEDS